VSVPFLCHSLLAILPSPIAVSVIRRLPDPSQEPNKVNGKIMVKL
jgi:hypothetical protein